mgnify:FL=1|tara:strand:- start:1780 stop:2052 length:273 start_codon:yes stop_codon:yes gene_type:complete
MTRPIPLRFPTSIKQLRVERVAECYTQGNLENVNLNRQGRKILGYWRIWLMANGDFSIGTYIQLQDDGTINRVTWHEDGTESIFEVTDND